MRHIPEQGAADPHLLQSYAEAVQALIEDAHQLHSWPACRQALLEMLAADPPWQLALPIFAARAAGGDPVSATPVAAGWIMLVHAATLLNLVQDGEWRPVAAVGSPQAALSCASGLIFAAFRLVNAEIKNPAAARRVNRIFAEAGFSAGRGQALSLAQAASAWSESNGLEAYWEAVILKSGSIFRAGAAAGAVAVTDDAGLIAALGDYGSALGVMRQIHDDCRDILSGPDTSRYEPTLPLLLYSLARAHRPEGRGGIALEEPISREALVTALQDVDVPELISEVLLEWQRRALESLKRLPPGPAVHTLAYLAERALEPG